MPFSDPITAGDTLVRNAIQSDNFVTGTSGWQIAKIGSAEFNSLVARGNITINDGIRSIVLDTIGSLAQLLFKLGGNAIGRLSVNSNVQPADLLIEGIFNAITNVAIQFNASSSFLRFSATNGTPAQDGGLYIEANKNARILRPLVATDNIGGTIPESWHDVTLQSGWTNFGAPFSNLQYRLLPHGYVGLEGTINPGTRASGTLLGTLPAGYQPTQAKRVLWAEVGFVGALDIATNGQITLAGAVPAGVSTITVQTQFALGLI